MEKTTSKKRSAKDSEANPSGKPLPGDRTHGIDLEICFYSIQDGYDTQELQEAQILVVYGSSLAVSKQNLVKRKFSLHKHV